MPQFRWLHRPAFSAGLLWQPVFGHWGSLTGRHGKLTTFSLLRFSSFTICSFLSSKFRMRCRPGRERCTLGRRWGHCCQAMLLWPKGSFRSLVSRISLKLREYTNSIMKLALVYVGD